MKRFTENNWTLLGDEVKDRIGRSAYGVLIDAASLLAGAHFLGARGMNDFVLCGMHATCFSERAVLTNGRDPDRDPPQADPPHEGGGGPEPVGADGRLLTRTPPPRAKRRSANGTVEHSVLWPCRQGPGVKGWSHASHPGLGIAQASRPGTGRDCDDVAG